MKTQILKIMKKTDFYFKSLLLAFAVTLTAGCSSNADDDEYRSTPPIISDMDFRMLSDGSTQLRAGEKIVATVVQGNRGHLLNGTTYDWSFTPNLDNISHAYKKSVIYDYESSNPTDTIIFQKPGNYKVTFSGNYKISGQADGYNSSTKLPNGTSVTYRTEGIVKYSLKVEKNITVR